MTDTPDEPARPVDPLLFTIKMLGGLLDDLEKVRIANGNRIGALEREVGGAFPHLELIQEALGRVEHQAELELKRAWRRHPLAHWAKAIPGAGEKVIPRLVAEVGDPGERPNPGKLLAYCGHGDPARSEKRSGMTQAELFKRGNPKAKMRTYLLSESLMKRQCPACKQMRDGQSDKDPWAAPPPDCTCAEISGYRALYNETRVRYMDATHEKACVRCGPSGHPAPPGSPLSEKHKHGRAMRAVGKEFLINMWRASNGMPARAREGPTPTPATPARATVPSTPPADTPARAKPLATPNLPSPARAIAETASRPHTPARAIRRSTSISPTPARAIIRPTPQVGTPARAMDGTTTTELPPARAITATTPMDRAPARAKPFATPRPASPARAAS